jgi:hypothetical protein
VYLRKARSCVLSDSVPITGLKSERASGVSVGNTHNCHLMVGRLNRRLVNSLRTNRTSL